MEDAAKNASTASAKTDDSVQSPKTKSKEAFVGYVDNSATEEVARTSGGVSTKSTSAKALDRWFKDRQQPKGRPNLLEIPNEALVTTAGPLQLTGNITVVEEDGRLNYANHLTLCRCGRSGAKPACDNQHVDTEFFDAGKIYEASDAPSSKQPSKLTISCIKDGPLTFRGRLKVRNSIGQECTKLRGALCRCGHSTNKPFCDGSHTRNGFKTG